MKRRKFIKAAGASALVTGTGANALSQNAEDTDDAQQQMLEMRRYTFKFGGSKKALNDYLKDALIPALNRHGAVNIGVFTELGESDPAKLYLLIPYNSMAHMAEVQKQLSADSEYGEASKAYHERPVDQTVYSRYDTWLMEAFSAIPKVEPPQNGERLFEIRTYEGYSENAVARKMKMFNVEELPLFRKLNLTPVFFAKMLSGPNMPALTYMLTYKSMDARGKAWSAFVKHPEWNAMKVKPEYANSVSNIIKVFLKPTAYSQI